MTTWTQKIKHELVALLPPTLYFFVVLHVIALIRALMNRDVGITLPTFGAVTVSALILGKAVLIADMLPFVNRFPERALIWNVGWKSMLYWALATLLHYLERLFDFWRDAPDLLSANRALIDALVWPHFWAIQLLLALLIPLYCMLSELSRALGPGKLRKMFFGNPAGPK